MKVVITGPVCTDKYFGGVATFTEGLADAFKLDGNEVYILTDYSNKPKTINGVEIIAVRDKPGRKSFKTHRLIKEKVNSIKPDFVVSSLEYGLANKKFDKAIKSIHFLHAFPSIKRSAANNFFVKHVTRYIVNKSDYTISNSGLTSTINGEIFKIPSSDIVNVDVGYEFLEKYKEVRDDVTRVLEKGKKHILFTGRLVKEKNVDYIIKAFGKLNLNNIVLDIVGDGPEKESLISLANSIEGEIKFHKKVAQDEVVKYYRDSDVFISLNPHEPYGIVYLEALVSNTNIVCPKTGGQMDTLVDYKDRVAFINPYDPIDIAQGMKEALNMHNEPFSDDYIYKNFSYSKAALEIKDIYLKKIK